MKTDFGFNCPVKVKKETNPLQNLHWQDDFELIIAIKGTLSLSIGFEKFILNQGDIMIVNSLESHSFSYLEDNTEIMTIELHKEVCLKINPFFYESIAIVDYSVGFLQLQEYREKVTKSIVALLKALPQEKVVGNPDRYMLRKIHQRLEELLNTISSVYRPKILKGQELIVAPVEKIEMLYRMIAYLYGNYNKNPSLEDFLKKEHYSLYYMSHVIVEITGTSFRDWLTYVRVEESEKLLLATDMPISRVAKEVGFSSVRYYNANFKKWYGFTPLDYRRLYMDIFDEGPSEPGKDYIDAENYLISFMKEKEQAPEERIISIDLSSGKVTEMPEKAPAKESVLDYKDLKDKERWRHLSSLDFTELITTEGRKTPAYFFDSLLSHFENKETRVTPYSVVSVNEDEILILTIHKEEFSLEHEMDDFRLQIDHIYGKYKVATYKFDFDFMKNDTSIVGEETIEYLSPEDFQAINAMHEPYVYFETIDCTGNFELRFRLLGNSCQLLAMQKIHG